MLERGGEIPDRTVDEHPSRDLRTAFGTPSPEEIDFSSYSHELLLQLLEKLGADRAFLLVRTLPDSAEQAGSPLEVVHAVAKEGLEIEDPDYHIDHHYLREISGIDGARFLAGAEEGASRPLLTLSFALDSRNRGVVALEGEPGSRSLSQESCERLESALAKSLPALRRLHTIEVQRRRLESLSLKLEELEKTLELREMELGGVRSSLEEDRFFQEDVTHYQKIITRSPKMKELFNVIERIKDTDLNVLVLGETGTGKELIARAIHFGGNRCSQPFEVVACGSIPLNLLESELFGYRKGAFSGADQDRKGVFERAHGGTLFLDEVSDMPPEMQQKILRVLQERVVRPIGSDEQIPVNVRVISSSQHDLGRLVHNKKFREDLYYRLNVITLEVPPLRDRREDIPLLLDHFLEERCEEEESTKRFSESAKRELYQYSWPGNVQELKNVVTRAFLASSRKMISRRVVQPLLARQAGNLFHGQDLAQEGNQLRLTVPSREGFNEIIAECEKLILLTALRRNRGNKSRVTQQLGIPRQTLYNKLEKYDIQEKDYMSEEE